MMVAGPEREMELVLRDRALEPAGKGEALLGGGGESPEQCGRSAVLHPTEKKHKSVQLFSTSPRKLWTKSVQLMWEV